MKLDNSIYSEFWRNPELCRLEYCRDIVPKKKPDYWITGGLFSKAVLYGWRKKKDSEIRALLMADKEDQLKKADREKFVDKVMRWYLAFSTYRLNVQYVKVDAERPFEFPLESRLGYEHTAVGSMDEVLSYAGVEAVSELKTENKTARTDHTYRWKHDSQASMYALALCKGQPEKIKEPIRIFVTVVKDLLPPRVLPFGPFERSAEQLVLFKRSLEMTADTICMLRDYYGDDEPWAHTINSYPCSMNACGHAGICNRLKIPPIVLERDFKKRIEHLKHVKSRF